MRDQKRCLFCRGSDLDISDSFLLRIVVVVIIEVRQGCHSYDRCVLLIAGRLRSCREHLAPRGNDQT